MDTKQHKKIKWMHLPEPSKVILARKRKRDREKPIDPHASFSDMLALLSVRNLRVVAKNIGVTLGVRRKDEIISKISQHLLDKEVLLQLINNLTKKEMELLSELVRENGSVEYNHLVQHYGGEEKDSPYWFLMPPNSPIGKLRSRGLIFVGEMLVNAWLKIMVCIPEETLNVLAEEVKEFEERRELKFKVKSELKFKFES